MRCAHLLIYSSFILVCWNEDVMAGARAAVFDHKVTWHRKKACWRNKIRFAWVPEDLWAEQQSAPSTSRLLLRRDKFPPCLGCWYFGPVLLLAWLNFNRVEKWSNVEACQDIWNLDRQIGLMKGQGMLPRLVCGEITSVVHLQKEDLLGARYHTRLLARVTVFNSPTWTFWVDTL